MNGRKTSSIGLDNAARNALNGILAKSINEMKEYGGMIYMEGGSYKAMPPRTQRDPTMVDVGQHEPNCSCPPGTIPVAYYHTHPTYSIAGMKGRYNEFSDDDKDVARDHNLDAAYLGSLDGSFLKFDRKENKVIPLPGRLKNTE
jgi:hypothetical protein